MSLRILEDASALGPMATQPALAVGAPADELPATVPAVAVTDSGFDLGALFFIIGLALLAGYLTRDRGAELAQPEQSQVKEE